MDTETRREAMLARLANNAGLVRRVIEQFQSTSPALIEQLQAAVRSGDSAAASRVAHQLKGAAGYLEAPEFVTCAGQLEGAADAATQASCLPALLAAYRHLEISLAELLGAL